MGTHIRGEVGQIVQPIRCVGGHVSVGQNGSDTQRCGAEDGGHVCVGGHVSVGQNGSDTQRCGAEDGGHVCVGGHPNWCVGGGQMNVCVYGTVHAVDGHGCTDTGHPMVRGGHTGGAETGQPTVGYAHGTDGHGWHETFGCDGGQWPGGHVKRWTVGHGWHEYAGCDTGHSGHVMWTDGQFGGAESGGFAPPPGGAVTHWSGGQVT